MKESRENIFDIPWERRPKPKGPASRFVSTGSTRVVTRDSGRRITLRDIGGAIARWKFVVLAATVLGALIGVVMASSVTPTYVAKVALISDASLSGIFDPRSDDPLPAADPNATQTVVETIGSNVVIRQVIGALPATVLEKIKAQANLEERLASAVLPENAGPDALENLEITLLSNFISGNFGVDFSGRSYVIYVWYRSPDPVIAMTVANTLSSSYLDYRSELKHSGDLAAWASLTRELSTLKTELLNADRTAQTMREEMRILAGRSEALTGAQQDEAIAESAELFSRQREAEREAEATAAIYERLLLQKRELQSRIEAPAQSIYLFAPAVVPISPSGFNAKPAILFMGILAGFLVGTSTALLLQRSPRLRRSAAAKG